MLGGPCGASLSCLPPIPRSFVIIQRLLYRALVIYNVTTKALSFAIQVAPQGAWDDSAQYFCIVCEVPEKWQLGPNKYMGDKPQHHLRTSTDSKKELDTKYVKSMLMVSSRSIISRRMFEYGRIRWEDNHSRPPHLDLLLDTDGVYEHVAVERYFVVSGVQLLPIRHNTNQIGW